MPKQHQVRVFHDDDKKVADIREVFAGLERAFHAKDTEKFDSHFTADAVFVTPAGTMLRGWEEICAYHEENLGGLDDEVHAAMQARYRPGRQLPQRGYSGRAHQADVDDAVLGGDQHRHRGSGRTRRPMAHLRPAEQQLGPSLCPMRSNPTHGAPAPPPPSAVVITSAAGGMSASIAGSLTHSRPSRIVPLIFFPGCAQVLRCAQGG